MPTIDSGSNRESKSSSPCFGIDCPRLGIGHALEAWIELRTNKRLLLAIYLVALTGLLLFPIRGLNLQLLGIGVDKWMHVALFGGLAIVMQWNLSTHRRAALVSIGATVVVATAAEIAQGLVTYRSAEWWDLLAGFFGAILGTLAMSQVLSYRAGKKTVGLVVVVLGLSIGALFIFADLVGVGDGYRFGTTQIVGTLLGALVTIGGITLHSSYVAQVARGL